MIRRRQPIRRRVRPRARRQGQRAAIARELDALWSLKVRMRDGHRCQLCGQLGTDAHHIFGRARLSTRWRLENGVTLCRFHCHRLAHRYSMDFKARMNEQMGPAFAALRVRAGQARKVDLAEVRAALVGD